MRAHNVQILVQINNRQENVKYQSFKFLNDFQILVMYLALVLSQFNLRFCLGRVPINHKSSTKRVQFAYQLCDLLCLFLFEATLGPKIDENEKPFFMIPQKKMQNKLWAAVELG